MKKPIRKPKNASSRWTFLSNHAHVILLLSINPDQVLRELATKIGITERAVQRIVQDLEAAGYIKISKNGRKNEYRVYARTPLRHPIEMHCSVGDLIEALTTKRAGG